MEAVKLIVGKLNNSLQRDEIIKFENWIDDSEINRFMYLRLKQIQEKGVEIDEKVFNVNTLKAWRNIESKIKREL